MVTASIGADRFSLCRFPVGRGEQGEVVPVRHGGQSGEHVLEVGKRIDAAALAGDDQGVDDGGAVASVGMANEEPVFLSDGRRPDG